MAKYIEYDVALQFVYDACTECMESCEEFDGIYPDCHKCLLEGVKLKLRHTPAADVRPVRRGKWEAVMLDHERMGCRPTAHYCSECHQITWFRTFFCPNCGADMKEANDEKA